MEEYELGTIKRADKIGLTGREYLRYCKCTCCDSKRWVRKEYVENYKCRNCKSRDSIAAKNLNNYVHLHDCKCLRCRIGGGCLKGKNNHMWRGGKKLTKFGYIYVYVEDNSPYISMCANGVGTNYVAEHRLNMAKHIGRPLKKSETVHHVNGVRADNRITNLELWSSNHQSGQRVSDQIKWAKKLLIENGYSITKKKKHENRISNNQQQSISYEPIR